MPAVKTASTNAGRFFGASLAEIDPEIAAAIGQELGRNAIRSS